MGSSIVGLGDRMEPFLPSRVPDLQPDLFLADAETLFLVVDPHRRNVVLGKVIIDVLIDERRLAHCRVTQNQ